MLYGLHPNAEINIRTVQGDQLFRVVAELQDRSQMQDAGNEDKNERINAKLHELLELLPELMDLDDLAERLETRGPMQTAFYQVCLQGLGRSSAAT